MIAVVVALLLLAPPPPSQADVTRNYLKLILHNTDEIRRQGSENEALLKGLTDNAVTYKGITTKLVTATVGGALVQVLVQAGIGWVLDQYGLNSGIEDQIAAIGTQLNQIQDSLNKIDAATTQLRTELRTSSYETQVREAGDIITPVDTATKDLEFVAHMSNDDPAKKILTEATLKKIDHLILIDAQGTLADKVGGIPGAPGLIAAAYQVALAHHRFWTLLNSLDVRAVAAYYESAEVRLLMLRVEYLHTHQFSGQYIEDQIKHVEEKIAEQQKLLKPDPEADVIADTRTNLDWLGTGLSYEGTDSAMEKLAAEVGTTGLLPESKFVIDQFGFPIVEYVYHDVGKGWRLPHFSEVLSLIAGWSDPSNSWVSWLNRETGVHWGDAPNGVWSADRNGFGMVVGISTSGGAHLLRNLRSPFLVRTRTHTYW